MRFLPDQVHEGVSSGQVSALACHLLLGVLTGCSHSRPDGGHQDDAQDHCKHRGDHVVSHGPAAHFTRQLEVQGPDRGNQGGDDQGNDDALEHLEEQLSDELDVHGLPGGPGLLPGLEADPQDHTGDDATHGGQSEYVGLEAALDIILVDFRSLHDEKPK